MNGGAPASGGVSFVSFYRQALRLNHNPAFLLAMPNQIFCMLESIRLGIKAQQPKHTFPRTFSPYFSLIHHAIAPCSRKVFRGVV